MSLSYFELAKQFFGGIIFFLLLFLFASIIRKKESLSNGQNTWNELYVWQVLFFVLCVSYFAILKTNFNTINIGLLGILIFEFFRRKVYTTHTLNLKGLLNVKRQFIYAICVYCFWFIFVTASLHFDNIPDVIRSPQRDLIYYSNLSQQLVDFGREDMRLSVHDSLTTGRSAYHYFELWVNGLIGNVLGIEYFKTFVLSTKVILLSLCSLLFYSIVSLWTDNEKKWVFLFAPLLLFIKPLLVFNMPNLKGFVDYYLFDPREQVYFLYFLIEIYFFLKWRQLSFIGLSMLILAAVTTIPALVPFASILLMCKVIWKWKALKYSSFMLFFGSLCFLILFYYFNKSSMPGSTSFSLASYFNSLQLKTSLNIFVGNFIFLGLVSIPFLIVCGIVIAINKINILSFFKQIGIQYSFLSPLLILLIIVSNAAYALLYPMSDSSQVFNNISMTLIVLIYGLLIFVLLTKFQLQYKLATYFPIGILILFCAYQSFFGSIDFSNEEKVSKSYFSKIKNFSIQGRVTKGVSFPSVNFYGMIQNWNDKLTWLGQYLYYINPNLMAINIDIDSTRINSQGTFEKEWQKNLTQNSHIQKFIKKYRPANDSFMKMSDYQLKYIKQNNIDFVIVDVNNSLPSTIANLVMDSVIDSYSNQKFYLLKK